MCDNRMFFVFVLLADAGAGSVPALGERPLPVVLYAHFPVLCDNRMFFVFQLFWQMPARAAYLLWANVLGPWFFLPISSPV